jgi:hypothetical protein
MLRIHSFAFIFTIFCRRYFMRFFRLNAYNGPHQLVDMVLYPPDEISNAKMPEVQRPQRARPIQRSAVQGA